MHIVLLSGGSGKRLWPLSNDIRSKQFIKLFKKDDGTYESMVQRIFNQIKKVDSGATVTIATSKSQVSAIHNQIGMNVGISVEPYRRDTFAAIVLATAYLHDIQRISDEEVVVVCPVDPYVDDGYFETLKIMAMKVEQNNSNLVLMGIKPTYASDKYGYIIPSVVEEANIIERFVEKPSKEEASIYIKQGALWNGGVFAYKIKYVLKKAKDLLGSDKYEWLYKNYESLQKISFDYAVVEKESKIQFVTYDGEWKDIGTWNTITEVMNEPIIGDGILDENCENVHILNELDIPILAMGLKNVVISASPDGILVSDKIQSGYIKQHVDKLNQKAMYAEKSWGVFHVLDVGTDSLTIKITMKACDHMNYHSHEHRDEVWTIVSGQGKVVLDGLEKFVTSGDVITIQAGCKHTIFSITDLVLIEVQIGKEITSQDKRKYVINDSTINAML